MSVQSSYYTDRGFIKLIPVIEGNGYIDLADYQLNPKASECFAVLISSTCPYLLTGQLNKCTHLLDSGQ